MGNLTYLKMVEFLILTSKYVCNKNFPRFAKLKEKKFQGTNVKMEKYETAASKK